MLQENDFTLINLEIAGKNIFVLKTFHQFLQNGSFNRKKSYMDKRIHFDMKNYLKPFLLTEEIIALLIYVKIFKII